MLAYGLVAAFIFVLTAGVGLLWRTDEEWARVEDRMNAWTQAAETSGELGPTLAAIYTAGVQPPLPGEKSGPSPMAEIRKSYEGRFGIVAERVRSHSIAADREAVLKELDNIQTGAQAMLGMAETLRGAARPDPADVDESNRFTDALRLMEGRYQNAVKALQRLQQHERNFAIELSRERVQLTEKYHRVAYGTAAALMLIFAASIGSLGAAGPPRAESGRRNGGSAESPEGRGAGISFAFR